MAGERRTQSGRETVGANRRKLIGVALSASPSTNSAGFNRGTESMRRPRLTLAGLSYGRTRPSLAQKSKLIRTSPQLYRVRPDGELSSVDVFTGAWPSSRAIREVAFETSGQRLQFTSSDNLPAAGRHCA